MDRIPREGCGPGFRVEKDGLEGGCQIAPLACPLSFKAAGGKGVGDAFDVEWRQ